MSQHSTLPEGLSAALARQRLAEDGPNELVAPGRYERLALAREIAAEPMVLLLLACGALYLVLGDRGEALMLLGFVAVVAAITFFQRRRTERSLTALRELSSPRALVLREGGQCRIPARELVRGDIVLVGEGDRVPADMALLEASSLAVDESMLTGESVPVDKDAGGADGEAALLYSGTLVTRGSGRARVTATGPRSALGRIGGALAGVAAAPTPIQQQTQRVVKQVAALGLLLAAVVAAVYSVQRGDWLAGLLAGLTLAMAILPEEFPVVLTLFLGLGAWRLAREQVLARSIAAVERLGATTVLCVDKTGTLTANRMAVRRLWSDGALWQADGAPLQEELHALLEYAVLASHRRAFDPMETAIGTAGAALLANTEHLHADWRLVDDYPLSPQMLAMSRVWQSPDGNDFVIAAKGAPEAVMDLCHLPPAAVEAIGAQVALMAGLGLRVLGVARARFRGAPLPGNQHDFDFSFLGLVGLQDPVRPEVPAAIAECQAAGIRVVMITGDHPATAQAIAAQAGLATDREPITGAQLDAMDDGQLRRRLPGTAVFCRVRPEQKLRLVQAFRADGEVVALVGDGINDAPALRAADIGVAMGARGTDVAREAAALVLVDDDFASLLTAVRYGRRVFANLRKAIVFIVAVHTPIVGLSVLPLVFGWPLLLMPVHILFLQLIIDPACALVFEAEPVEGSVMRARPRDPAARLFDGEVLLRGLAQGAVLLATLAALFALARRGGTADDAARALCFVVLVLSNLALIAANRSWDGRLLSAAPNPYFGWIAGATVAALAAVLGIPVVRQLFGFAAPGAPLLLLAVALAAVNMLCFAGISRAAVRAKRL
ncbi:HAD-IC family P-type ATPase [Massilia terrae]